MSQEKKYRQLVKLFVIFAVLSYLLMIIWMIFPQLRANIFFEGNVEVARAAQISRFGLSEIDRAILAANDVSFSAALIQGTGIAVLLSISGIVCFGQSIRYRNKIARVSE